MDKKDHREEQYRLVLNWDGKTRFREFDLSKRDLSGLELPKADFRGANLSGAYLSEADLSRAYLNEAIIAPEQLAQAKLLIKAIMPDGTQYT